MSNRVSQQVAIKPLIERHYIDITTNQINTGTGVTGTDNAFTAEINAIKLDQNKHWTIEVIAFGYKNKTDNVPTPYYPIVLCDLSEVINVNNTTSSIIFKSNILTNVDAFVVSDISNNYNIVRPITKSVINRINVQIVRSDNGEPFVFAGSSSVSLLFLIKGE